MQDTNMDEIKYDIGILHILSGYLPNEKIKAAEIFKILEGQSVCASKDILELCIKVMDYLAIVKLELPVSK